MLQPVYTKKFGKSVELCKKRGYDMQLLKDVILILLASTPIPAKYRTHKLKGIYEKHWECHIKPDWLLIYRYSEDGTQIIFEETGTHSDLF
ncbi:MAG: type II toxin-antitoxin system YafQ family toxin [Bacteroidetes bacterium]|nr:type II toxin-antitoxin system YafQ family toxin [Bacteroidota bacterium]